MGKRVPPTVGEKHEVLRVFIADDHAVVREGIRAILDREEGFEVVGEASAGREALDAVAALQPDVAVLDISLPELSGIDVTRRLAELAPECRVVILSMHRDKDHVGAAVAAGARGYVPKDEADSELVEAIRSVASGRVHVSPLATEALAASVRTGASDEPAADAPPESPQRRSPLSPRETEVLKLVAAGLSTKEVAWRLKISPKTADAHRQAIMKKLSIHDVPGLVKYALKEGLTELA